MITLTGHIGTLLDGMLTKNVVVSLLFEFISFGGDNLIVSDDSDASTSIQSLVFNLSLEWEAFNLCKVNVFHFNKLGHLFQTIFKRNFGIFSYITQVFDQERAVFRQQCLFLVSE